MYQRAGGLDGQVAKPGRNPWMSISHPSASWFYVIPWPPEPFLPVTLIPPVRWKTSPPGYIGL